MLHAYLTFRKFFIYNHKFITNKTLIANTFNTFFTNIGPNLAKQISNPINRNYRYYLNEQHVNSILKVLTKKLYLKQ